MNSDHRKHPRFLAQEDTFASLAHKKIGKVKNISMEGLAFEYIDLTEDSDQVSSHRDTFEPLQLRIFLSKQKFYLSNVPCNLIHDEIAPVSVEDQKFIRSLTPRCCGVKFRTLSKNIMAKLEFFLNNHTTELSS